MIFALAFPAIDPVAVEIGPVAIRWYALAYVVGLLLGWQYVRYLAGKCIDGLTKRHADDLVVWCTLGIVVGGRPWLRAVLSTGLLLRQSGRNLGGLAGGHVLSRRAPWGAGRRGPLRPA